MRCEDLVNRENLQNLFVNCQMFSNTLIMGPIITAVAVLAACIFKNVQERALPQGLKLVAVLSSICTLTFMYITASNIQSYIKIVTPT